MYYIKAYNTFPFSFKYQNVKMVIISFSKIEYIK